MSAITSIRVVNDTFALMSGDEVLGCISRFQSDWIFVPLIGNRAGKRHLYASLEDAFDRAQRYTPWSNEGIDP